MPPKGRSTAAQGRAPPQLPPATDGGMFTVTSGDGQESLSKPWGPARRTTTAQHVDPAGRAPQASSFAHAVASPEAKKGAAKPATSAFTGKAGAPSSQPWRSSTTATAADATKGKTTRQAAAGTKQATTKGRAAAPAADGHNQGGSEWSPNAAPHHTGTGPDKYVAGLAERLDAVTAAVDALGIKIPRQQASGGSDVDLPQSDSLDPRFVAPSVVADALAVELPKRIIAIVYSMPKALTPPPAGGGASTAVEGSKLKMPTTWRQVLTSRPRLAPRALTQANAKMAATLPRVPQLTALLQLACVIAGRKYLPSAVALCPDAATPSFDFGALAPLLGRVMLYQLWPRRGSVAAAPVDGLTDDERAPLTTLREAAGFLLALIAERAQAADVLNVVDYLFPMPAGRIAAAVTAAGWGAEHAQPLLAPVLHDDVSSRCAAGSAVAAALCTLSEKLTLAEEASATGRNAAQLRSSVGAAFTSLSQRLAGVLHISHLVLVTATLDDGDTDARSRGRLLNALGTIAQFTPFSRCPSAAAAFFGGLLRSDRFRESLATNERARQTEKIAAHFCLTAVHRNKFAFFEVRKFFAGVATAESSARPAPRFQATTTAAVPLAQRSSVDAASLTLAAVLARKDSNSDEGKAAGSAVMDAVVAGLPGLEAFRVVSSLAKEHPHLLRPRWPRIFEAVARVMRGVTISGGPDDLHDDGEQQFTVTLVPLGRVLGPDIQVPTEAVRTVLYYMGPTGAKYSEEQWVAELSGGTYLHSTAINHGATVASDANALAVDARSMLAKTSVAGPVSATTGLKVARFAVPLPMNEAAGRGPNAGARATSDERAAFAVSVVLRARYAKLEGVRRLGFRGVAHLGSEAFEKLKPADASEIIASVLEDGPREPQPRLIVDMLLTVQSWALNYPFFANTKFFSIFVDRLVRVSDRNAASLAIITAAASVALTIAQRSAAVLRATPPADEATRFKAVLLRLFAKCGELADDYKYHAQVAGNCLKAMAAIASTLDDDFLISPIAGNEEGVANEVLTRIDRAIATAKEADEAAAAGVGNGLTGAGPLPPSHRLFEAQMTRALACLAAKDALGASAVRMADPQAASTVLDNIVRVMLQRPTFVERTAAVRALQGLAADVIFASSVHAKFTNDPRTGSRRAITPRERFDGVVRVAAELLQKLASCSRFAKSSAEGATLKQVRQLETISGIVLTRVAEFLLRFDSGRLALATEYAEAAAQHEAVARAALEREQGLYDAASGGPYDDTDTARRETSTGEKFASFIALDGLEPVARVVDDFRDVFEGANLVPRVALPKVGADTD